MIAHKVVVYKSTLLQSICMRKTAGMVNCLVLSRSPLIDSKYTAIIAKQPILNIYGAVIRDLVESKPLAFASIGIEVSYISTVPEHLNEMS